MTACANNGGGVVYFPMGLYRTTSTLSWTSDAPVVFLGGNRGGAAICLDAASPVNGLAVTNASSVSLSQLDFLADGDNTGGTSIQYAAVYCDGLHKVTIEECFVAAGEGNVGWNTAFQFTDCLGSMVSTCYIAAESQCVWFNGGNGWRQHLRVRDIQFRGGEQRGLPSRMVDHRWKPEHLLRELLSGMRAHVARTVSPRCQRRAPG